ncbi:MAG: (2Fe-2S) ferredoxin domain-containing protein [Cyanobacteria bacterium P01_A01_bin.40]
MKTSRSPHSTYTIVGEFISFIPKPGGKFKYIQVQVKERIIAIKLAKELRENLGQTFSKGDRLAISVEQKAPGRFSPLKLKSDHIMKLENTTINTQVGTSASVLSSISSTDKSHSKLESTTKNVAKGTVLICHQSSCSKRGGKKLYDALKEALKELGLQHQVQIKLTGCQKQCKKAPSLILMPGKVKHHYVYPSILTSILKTHYL